MVSTYEREPAYPNFLREWVDWKGYKVKRLADATGIPVRTMWEYIGKRTIIEPERVRALAAALDCTPDQLLYGPAPTKPLSDVSTQEAESEDMQRREALQIFSITGVSLLTGLSSPTQEKLQELENVIARKMARFQGWVIDSLEDNTHLRWQLYYTSRNTLTEDGLVTQIERLEQLADEGGKHYRRVCRVLAQNYQLAGSLARDAFHYKKALDYFNKAEQLADDVQLPDLMATAVVRQGLALLRRDQKGDLDKALVLYQGAADLSAHAEPHTKAYVLSGLAEVLARHGHQDACYKALDEAEMLLTRSHPVPLEEDFAYVRLTLQSLEDSRGECAVLLGEAEKGLAYLLQAQQHLDQKMSRNMCRLLMQQSEAYLAAGHPDLCVQHAVKGLEVARVLESASSINWSREIYGKLLETKWKHEAVVKGLYTAINS